MSTETEFIADVGIKDGIIAAIDKNLTTGEIVDAESCWVLPGAVDPHVHLQMPMGSIFSSDNWETGTIAAVCGGTTTIIDFVEPEDTETLIDAFNTRLREAQDRACIDFGLHMTIASAEDSVLEEISNVVRRGVVSFKHYTTYDFQLSDDDLLKSFFAVHASGGLSIVHCENDAIIRWKTGELITKGLTSPAYHPLSRPAEAEREAIERVISFSRVIGSPLYIVHVSTEMGAEAVAAARKRGQIIYAETCPQYLLLTQDIYESPGFEAAKFVCSPPLRSQKDMSSLWDYLAVGSLHVVATDHCPFFFLGQKDLGRDTFVEIPSGLPGIEARLALIHSAGVVTGKLSPQRWVEICCTAPAKIFGLYPKKGEVAVGSDADLVIFDPKKRITLGHAMLHENVDYTPYEGINLNGFPHIVLVKGEIAVLDGEFVGDTGAGEYLARKRMNPERCF